METFLQIIWIFYRLLCTIIYMKYIYFLQQSKNIHRFGQLSWIKILHSFQQKKRKYWPQTFECQCLSAWLCNVHSRVFLWLSLHKCLSSCEESKPFVPWSQKPLSTLFSCCLTHLWNLIISTKGRGFWVQMTHAFLCSILEISVR